MGDDHNAPATKGDLQDLESRIEGKLDASEQRVLDRVEIMIRDTETRLLQAFYSFAETNQKRLWKTATSPQRSRTSQTSAPKCRQWGIA
jgi:hypothetical protein